MITVKCYYTTVSPSSGRHFLYSHHSNSGRILHPPRNILTCWRLMDVQTVEYGLTDWSAFTTVNNSLYITRDLYVQTRIRCFNSTQNVYICIQTFIFPACTVHINLHVQEKSTTLFSTITLAFLGRFYNFFHQ